MQANFDVFEYAGFLRQHWRALVFASLGAIVLSLGASLSMPKRYTASASIVIEPPGGVDARTATAVSPIYLESLKTYERYAESDSLFAKAAEQFHFGGRQAIESLKQRVLKVDKLRDTKILMIEVTLPDPQLAHSVAEYLARQTVELSRSESRAADAEMIGEWDQQAAAARQTLERAQKAWADDARQESADSLQADLDGLRALQFDIRRQIADARADAAEFVSGEPTATLRAQAGAATARANALEQQAAGLERRIATEDSALAARKAHAEQLQRDVEVAETNSESAATRLRDLRAANGTRGERLNVIDPGIVPQRPVSPNIPLNVVAALFLSLMLTVGYLSFAFAYQRRAIQLEPALSRARRAG